MFWLPQQRDGLVHSKFQRVLFIFLLFARWAATPKTSSEFSLSSAMHEAKLEGSNLPAKDVEPP